jgi:hypothetical protein
MIGLDLKSWHLINSPDPKRAYMILKADSILTAILILPFPNLIAQVKKLFR